MTSKQKREATRTLMPSAVSCAVTLTLVLIVLRVSLVMTVALKCMALSASFTGLHARTLQLTCDCIITA